MWNKRNGNQLFGVEYIDLSGVYQISNTIDNRIYIGGSKDLRTRFRTHKNKLKHNRNVHKLQDFYNTYGRNSLVYRVLEYCKPSIIKEREQYYLDNNTCEFNSYLSSTSGKGYTYIMNDEWKDKLSKALMGKKVSDATKERLRQMNVGKKHSDSTKAKMSKAHIGKKLSSKTRAKMSKIAKNNPKNKKHLQSMALRRQKPIIQYDKDMNFIKKYPSTTNAVKNSTFHNSAISSCCSGSRKTHGGFIWKYAKDAPSV